MFKVQERHISAGKIPVILNLSIRWTLMTSCTHWHMHTGIRSISKGKINFILFSEREAANYESNVT
jgi:hypothetical protein